MRRIETIVPMIMLGVVALLSLLVGPRLLRQYAVAEQSARIELARNELRDEDILRQLDRAVTAISDAVLPSVVHIETSGQRQGTASSGAGWVFDYDGHIVTNAHVVARARQISVEFTDGTVVGGRLVGSDVYTDIAVIRVNRRDGLFPVIRSETRLPRVGERVFAFGSPFGFKFSMSEGIVSGLGRSTPGSSMTGGYTNYIQTDAAVNPGNSGGPLINTDGQVIGMNVAIATAQSIGSNPEDSGGDSAGISFAIPLGTIEPIVGQLIEFGEVSRGFLGINFGEGSTNRDGLERVIFDDGTAATGVLVTSVLPGGPGEVAGLEARDVIVSIEGSPIVSVESLVSLVSSGRPGDTVDVEIWRDGESKSLSVKLAPIQPRVLGRRLAMPTMMQMGAVLQSSEEPGSILVSELFENSPAALSGLRAGDRIVSINGKRFPGASEFFVLLADEGLLSGDSVELGVLNTDDESRTVRIQLKP